MQFYRTLTLRWLMCVHESMKISTGCVLLVPKSHFCVLGFKRNWLPQIIDRDKDFWGLLDNLTFDLQFPEAEAQDTWHLSWIEHKIVSQPWKITNWVVLKSLFVYQINLFILNLCSAAQWPLAQWGWRLQRRQRSCNEEANTATRPSQLLSRYFVFYVRKFCFPPFQGEFCS